MGDIDLKVFSDGVDWFVASSPDEALDMWEQMLGENREDYPGKVFAPVPDDHVIKIRDEDEGKTVTSLTAKEWVARNGRGALCSTEI